MFPKTLIAWRRFQRALIDWRLARIERKLMLLTLGRMHIDAKPNPEALSKFQDLMRDLSRKRQEDEQDHRDNQHRGRRGMSLVDRNMNTGGTVAAS